MIGHTIKTRRIEAGLSQPALAVKAGIGEATLRRAETGRHHPNDTTIRRLAEALGVKVDDLISHDPELPTCSTDHGTNQPPPTLPRVGRRGPSHGE